jgi:hypothetical protein
MFVLVHKKSKRVYLSESKKEISKASGVNYNTLDYYSRKGDYHETLDMVFAKTDVIKSMQGGKRIKKEYE